MVNYSNPFLQSLGNIRTRPRPNQLMQPPPQATQPQAQPGGDQYDFAGWADRLDRIESGIGSLTKQFNSFQAPGEVEPEYQGNAAPEPLEQTANAPEPLPIPIDVPGHPTPPGGFKPSPMPVTPPGMEPHTLIGGPGIIDPNPSFGGPMVPEQDIGGGPSFTQNTGFNFDPSGGSLFDQLSTAYGQPATMQDQFNQDNPNYVSQAVAMGYAEPGTPHYIRGGGDYTQGFQDFVHDQGYYVDPRGSWVDGPMNISETPIDLPGKIRGTMQQHNPNQPFQTLASPSGGKMAGSDNLGFPGAKPVERPNLQETHTGITRPNPEWLSGLGALRPNDIANISEVTRPGIHNQGMWDAGIPQEAYQQNFTGQKIQQGLGSFSQGAGI